MCILVEEETEGGWEDDIWLLICSNFNALVKLYFFFFLLCFVLLFLQIDMFFFDMAIS